MAEPALNLKEEVLNREAVCNPLNDVEEPIVDETPVPEVINEVPKKFQFHLPLYHWRRHQRSHMLQL